MCFLLALNALTMSDMLCFNIRAINQLHNLRPWHSKAFFVITCSLNIEGSESWPIPDYQCVFIFCLLSSEHNMKQIPRLDIIGLVIYKLYWDYLQFRDCCLIR